MPLTINIVPRHRAPSIANPDEVFLELDNWNDHNFYTLFKLHVSNKDGHVIRIGEIKIGYYGQPNDNACENNNRTSSQLEDTFPKLGDNFFSLGQSVNYYEKLNELGETKENILKALNDVVFSANEFERAKNEPVFITSLMRDISTSTIKGSFARAMEGKPALSNFSFSYIQEINQSIGFSLKFLVRVESKPASNIHVLIGRNGVGKSKLFSDIVNSYLHQKFFDSNIGFTQRIDITNSTQKKITEYFAKLVAITFSVFDEFIPRSIERKSADDANYIYVGVRAENDTGANFIKDKSRLADDFSDSMAFCFAKEKNKSLWLDVLENLCPEINFTDWDLKGLINLRAENLKETASDYFNQMSSGHSYILLSLIKLIEHTEERTLVLIDEPENHLHPPLLSGFIRAISTILLERNALSIIATHSPVVLQEVPSSCVSVLSRHGAACKVEQPELETFAESIGILTREVFNLESRSTGYHLLLRDSSKLHNSNYQKILDDEYDGNIGFEGRSLLRAFCNENLARNEE